MGWVIEAKTARLLLRVLCSSPTSGLRLLTCFTMSTGVLGVKARDATAQGLGRLIR